MLGARLKLENIVLDAGTNFGLNMHSIFFIPHTTLTLLTNIYAIENNMFAHEPVSFYLWYILLLTEKF